MSSLQYPQYNIDDGSKNDLKFFKNHLNHIDSMTLDDDYIPPTAPPQDDGPSILFFDFASSFDHNSALYDGDKEPDDVLNFINVSSDTDCVDFDNFYNPTNHSECGYVKGSSSIN